MRSAGTPSRRTASSLPEVVGDAALAFDPSDVPALAAALVRVARDGELRADLRRRGLARAALFSWRRCAAETATVYEEAVGGRQPVRT